MILGEFCNNSRLTEPNFSLSRRRSEFRSVVAGHFLATSRSFMPSRSLWVDLPSSRQHVYEIQQGSRLDWGTTEYHRHRSVSMRLSVSCYVTRSESNLADNSCSESTSAPEGWGTPFVPSLFGTAIVLLVLFVLWEVRREAKNESVLLPMSIWIQPGVKMGPIILLVFFAWWGFNTLSYFVALFFQEIQMLNPLQTAIRLVPMGISVSSRSIAGIATASHRISTGRYE